MTDKVPPRYAAAIPYLIVGDADAALEFYGKAFGAIEILRLDGPGGRAMHAEMRIGSAMFMLAGAMPQLGYHDPRHFGGTPLTISVHVEDVDAFTAQAAQAGCTVLRAPADQFYGDRSAALEDPFGHRWNFATHIEDMTPEKMQAQLNKMFTAA